MMKKEVKSIPPAHSPAFFFLIPAMVFGLAAALAGHPAAAEDRAQALEAQLRKNPQDAKRLRTLDRISLVLVGWSQRDPAKGDDGGK